MSLIIELHYFPSIIWYKRLIENSHIKIDPYEHFQKMSFRNRCMIDGANGPMILSIPITGGRNSRQPLNEIEIDFKTRWQDIHWRSIYSAYNRSPWFEFYKPELQGFYESRIEKLWDWNSSLFQWSLKKLNWNPQVQLEKISKVESTDLDYRNKILPKNFKEFGVELPKYSQVFEARHGFTPNLSIIDLLFAEGPQASAILKSSV